MASNKISGHGATIIVTDAEDDSLIGNVSNTDFEIDSAIMEEEATDSSDVSVNGESILPSVEGWTIRQIDKTSSSPDLAGLAEGDRANVYFQRGSEALYDRITDTLVTRVRITNPQTGLRRIEISGKYGVLSRNVTL